MSKLTKILLVFIFGIISINISFAQETPAPVNDAAIEKVQLVDDGGTLYGTLAAPTVPTVNFADLMASPEQYDGKDIILKGQVKDVCQAEGCWLVMTDGNKDVLVKTLHVFVVPKDSFDNIATVNGNFKIKEISEEQARHLNDESKNSKIKSEDIKGPQKTFVINAAGIQLKKVEGVIDNSNTAPTPKK